FVANHLDALETVRDGALKLKSNIDISDYRLTESELSSLFAALRAVYPELFFVDLQYRYSYKTIGGVNYTSSLLLSYDVSSVSELNAMLDKFYSKADGYLSLVDDSMNDFTKALVLHDAIVMNSEYFVAKDGVSGTPYTLMVEGWGKCEDYSRAYAFLLAQLGIKSELVTSSSMNHEWMKIRLDGKYYQVDITWDDPISAEEGTDFPGRVSHEYFLFSDSTFPNHSGYYMINPSADTTYDNYYIHNMDSQLCMVKGAIYGIYCAKGESETKLVTYTARNEMTTVADLGAAVQDSDGFWAAHWRSNGNNYYVCSYSNLCSDSGLLYYNMPKAVYVYDPASGINLKLADYSGSNQLFGLKIDGGKLYGNDSAQTNSSGTLAELGGCLMMGDVDGDGVLNVVDATMIQKKVADLAKFDAANTIKADFDRDGKITVNDVTAIQYEIAK
ncbi:MAG: hypothetical protein II550_01320, partial [Ruminococcus sp.]|nr:hypothetical protein [Ruminococcus sp.]